VVSGLLMVDNNGGDKDVQRMRDILLNPANKLGGETIKINFYNTPYDWRSYKARQVVSIILVPCRFA